jgi:hypothetical protein
LEEAQKPVAFPACCAPWVDRIKFTPEEKVELNRAWDLLPGWTTQLMALRRIAEGTLEVPSAIIQEEFWSCRFCKHRNGGLQGEDEGLRCRGCGAQKADEPWEAPADDYAAPTVTDPELIDRALAGEVWTCGYCFNVERNEHDACSACGAERARAMQIQAEREHWRELMGSREEPPASSEAPSLPGLQKSLNEATWWILAGGIGLLLLIAGCVYFFGTHTSTGVVAQVRWERTAIVEERHIKHGEDWDGAMHVGAFDTECETRLKRYQNCNPHSCRPHRVGYSCNCSGGDSYACGSSRSCRSNGNGSRTCTDRTKYCTHPRRCDTCYRTEYDTCWDSCPVYDRWCRYSYPQWEEIARKRTAGSDLHPKWPDLAAHGADQRLRQLEGYEVHIRDAEHDWKLEPAGEVEFQCYDVGTTHRVEYTRAGSFKVKD